MHRISMLKIRNTSGKKNQRKPKTEWQCGVVMNEKIQHKKIKWELSVWLKAISVNILYRLFVDIEKFIPKFMWKGTGLRLSTTMFIKKKEADEITLLNLKAF